MGDAELTAILSVSPAVRYAALYRGGRLRCDSRAALDHASAAESDRYEELFVNTAMMTLLRQRGDVDCGGFEHVLVRYGNFWQLVVPLHDGHASICISREADVLAVASEVLAAVRELIRPGCASQVSGS